MAVMIEARSYRPFKSSEEYLYAMKEDLAEWLNTLYPEIRINVDNFMDRLDTGVALCKHANAVRESAASHALRRAARGLGTRGAPALPAVPFLPAARPSTFFARDNVSNFISWCRRALGIFECLLFETDDLIMRKNEKHVILCLLEVARKGTKFGMLAPMLVQMEQQIDREILLDARRSGQGALQGGQSDSDDEEDGSSMAQAAPMVYGPMPQIITNDLKSLDEMVRDLVERCNCPTQFPMIRVSEGKYRIGDTKVLIFVRVLRSHVMVRVGGGWDTLSHYLDKHDPCRCRAQHRSTHAARVVHRYPAGAAMDLQGAEVHYDRSPPRTRRSSVSSVGSSGGGSPQHAPLGAPQHTAARQRSRSPAPRQPADRSYASLPYMSNNAFENQAFTHLSADAAYQQSKYNRRSVSPSPARKTSTNRIPSPSPVRKTSNIPYSSNYVAQQAFTSPALVASPNLIPNPHRSNRSISPSKTSEILSNSDGRRMVLTPEKDASTNLLDNQIFSVATEISSVDGAVNGSENASDNGSEVSDEGYRSLGIIQNGSGQITSPGTGKDSDKALGLKLNRLSLNSQGSADDADMTERIDNPGGETGFKRQTSSSDCGSQMSITDDRSRGSEEGTTITNYSYRTITDRLKSSTPREEVSSVTGLRKTNYSETLYGDKKTPISMLEKKHTRNSSSPPICMERNDAPSQSLQRSTTSSKIPQSPILNRRRLSMENLSSGSRSRSGSRERSFARDRSMSRDPSSPVKRMNGKNSKDSASKPPVPVLSPTGVNVGSIGKVSGNKVSSSANNTWNGRTPVPKGKSRPGISNDTFSTPNKNQNSAYKVSSPPFQRNSNLRSSTTALRNMTGYDHNGRRLKGSPQTSPVKTALSKAQRSPLLEKILHSAEHAKDDAMMLEKMKDIIKQYAGLVETPNSGNDSHKRAVDDPDYSDFTSAWVHSNGTLERSQSSNQLRDSLNNCPVVAPNSEAGSNGSGENSSGLKSAALVSKIPMFSPRRDSKLGVTSRIPAPVSTMPYKKASDFYD